MTERPILLDCTRMIARSWSARVATGIDRVCDAYLRHFRTRARAVVQHRGMFRTLSVADSDRLFDLVQGPDWSFRSRMMTFAPMALARGSVLPSGGSSHYVNVGHTDFDLESHWRWTHAGGLRPVYLLHDLIPLTHAEFCEEHAVRRHRGRVIGALRSASGIIVNSRATQVELERFAANEKLPVPPVLASPLAGAALTRGAAMGEHSGHPYFVCLGTIEKRKNHAMLLRVWRRLLDRLGAKTPRLVIIGQWGVRAQTVRDMLRNDPRLAAHVTILNHCEDRDLARWMGGAVALLMPSIAEGFGLPVSEALRLGVPVIASDLACYRETGQGIPLLLPDSDCAAWERAIMEFANGHPARQRQLAAMRGYRAPSWAEHFADVDRWMNALPQSRLGAVEPNVRIVAKPPVMATTTVRSTPAGTTMPIGQKEKLSQRA